jgi:acyl carrier protein
MEDAQAKEYVQRMIDYVVSEVIQRPVELNADTLLVSSGLIDSLALVNILQYLEDVTHMRIPASKVQPKDMDSVALMLATARRVGKPRK